MTATAPDDLRRMVAREAESHLRRLAAALLELHAAPASPGPLRRALQEARAVTSGCTAIRLDEMARASRAVEDQLRPLEGGERAATPALVSGLLRAVTRLRAVAASQAEGIEDATEVDDLLSRLEEEMARTGAHWSDAFRQGAAGEDADAIPQWRLSSAPRTEIDEPAPEAPLETPPASAGSPPPTTLAPALSGLVETLENLRSLVAGLTQLEAEVGRRLFQLSHLPELDEVADALQRVRGASEPGPGPAPGANTATSPPPSRSQTSTYLVVSAANQRAAIPLSAAVTVLPSDAVHNGEVRVGDEQLPVIDLALVIGGAFTREGPVVVVEHQGQRRAFRVSDVQRWGELEPGDTVLDPAQLLG
jgi:chemotaxis protein histidine kinase CheA